MHVFRLVFLFGKLSADGMFALFVAFQDHSCPLHHIGRKPGQPRNLNPVALVSASRFHFAKEDHIRTRFLNRDVIVPDAGQQVFEFSEFVIVRGKSVRARVWVSRCSTTAHAMASPSKVAVPRPISSSSTRLRGVAVFKIVAVSVISTIK